MPFISGIATSSTTTSGLVSCTILTAARRSGARALHFGCDRPDVDRDHDDAERVPCLTPPHFVTPD